MITVWKVINDQESGCYLSAGRFAEGAQSSALLKQEKVQSYEHFLNDVLRADLKNTLDRHGAVQNKIAEYTQQKTILEKLTSSPDLSKNIRTKVDLGCDFYVDSVVENLETVVMNIGCGTWLEVTPEEAVKICDREITHLTKTVNLITKQELQLKANINLVINGLREIQNL